MPATLTYPGIYIEEVPSNSHSITAAPTSVTVFIGPTHPFKTNTEHWNEAVQIFSFTDYEREFGGLFTVDWLADDVGRAVYEFFLNGGSVAYVVAVRAQFLDPTGATADPTITPPTLTVKSGSSSIEFTGREPVDAHRRLMLTLTNVTSSTGATGPKDLADIVLAYGLRTETYRGVSLADGGKTLEQRLGTADSPVSALVTVSTSGGYPTVWPAALAPQALTQKFPDYFTTYQPSPYAEAFAEDKSLDKVDVFNLLLTPGVWDPTVVSEALAFCERKRAFMIVDPPADAVADDSGRGPKGARPLIGQVMNDEIPQHSIPKSQNGALYFPYLRSTDVETGEPLTVAPSGFVAGVFAREDANRGVWKAPAGLETIIADTTGVVASGRLTDARQGTLNPLGVNCLRGFPGIGTVVFGARTLVAHNPAFQQYRYVPVRRMALFLEQSLYANLGWATFEPNDLPLWTAIRMTIESFMVGLYQAGAFQGSTPTQAFRVVCDATTTTPDDQANGVVNVVVAFAPLKPAEFVVIKLAQLAGQSAA